MKLALIGLVAFVSAQAPHMAQYTVRLQTPSGAACTYTVSLRVPAGSTPRDVMGSQEFKDKALPRMAERCSR